MESLEADRVLRRIANLTAALVRTNYYQTGPDGAPKPYISFKIASRDLEKHGGRRQGLAVWCAGHDAVPGHVGDG